tara:strand:+ start:261 stop:536 length:276 start_codon:yes stop_codon:yes gene_type:complete
VEVNHSIAIDIGQAIWCRHPLAKKHDNVKQIDKAIPIQVGNAFAFVGNRVAILIQGTVVDFTDIKDFISIAVENRTFQELAFVGLAVAVAI